MTFFGIWRIISKMWESRFQVGLDDEFKSVFRIRIASVEMFGKNTSNECV